MTTTEKQLIEKLKELIKYLLKFIGGYEASSIRIRKFKDEIARLESEIEKKKITDTNIAKVKSNSPINNPDFFEKKIKDEITDADIEAWAKKIANIQCRNFAILGAKAMRDGIIKYIEK